MRRLQSDRSLLLISTILIFSLQFRSLDCLPAFGIADDFAHASQSAETIKNGAETGVTAGRGASAGHAAEGAANTIADGGKLGPKDSLGTADHLLGGRPVNEATDSGRLATTSKEATAAHPEKPSAPKSQTVQEIQTFTEDLESEAAFKAMTDLAFARSGASARVSPAVLLSQRTARAQAAANLKATLKVYRPDITPSKLAIIDKYIADSPTKIVTPVITKSDDPKVAENAVGEAAKSLRLKIPLGSDQDVKNVPLKDVAWLDDYIPTNFYKYDRTAGSRLERLDSGDEVSGPIGRGHGKQPTRLPSTAEDAPRSPPPVEDTPRVPPPGEDAPRVPPGGGGASSLRQPDLIGYWGRFKHVFEVPYRWVVDAYKRARSERLIKWLGEADHPLKHTRDFAANDAFAKQAARAREQRSFLGDVIFNRLRAVDRTRELFPRGAPGPKVAKAIWGKIRQLTPFGKSSSVTPGSTEIRGAEGLAQEGSKASHTPGASTPHPNAISDGAKQDPLHHEANPPATTHPEPTPETKPNHGGAEPQNEHPVEPKSPGGGDHTPPTDPVHPSTPGPSVVVKGKLPRVLWTWKKLTAPFRWISKRLGAWQTDRYTRTAAVYLRWLAKNGPIDLRERIFKDRVLINVLMNHEAQLAKAGYLRQSVLPLEADRAKVYAYLKPGHPLRPPTTTNHVPTTGGGAPGT